MPSLRSGNFLQAILLLSSNIFSIDKRATEAIFLSKKSKKLILHTMEFLLFNLANIFFY